MTASILQGDALQVLPTLPVDHFHCVVTSPPYFALRSYLPKDHPLKPLEIGSEPTPETFIQTMVRVFCEVQRVLRPDGLLFLNMGDSYSTQYMTRQGKPRNITQSPRDWEGTVLGGRQRSYHKSVKHKYIPDAKDGELLNMPHRVVEALRADGWIWRQTIVWAKKSPMPESCKGWRWERCRVSVRQQPRRHHRQRVDGKTHGATIDDTDEKAQWSPCPGCPKCTPHGGYVLRFGRGRCTTAHEYLFVMAKTDRYFWDSAAFREEEKNPGASAKQIAYQQRKRQEAGMQERKPPEVSDSVGSWKGREGDGSYTDGRNPRSVWLLSSEPTSLRHFATFPSELVRRCVQAGTSDGGCCPVCGMPWAPVVESEQLKRERPRDRTDYHNKPTGGNACGNTVAGIETRILGYRPTCECNVEPRVGIIGPVGGLSQSGGGIWTWGEKGSPCRVLDPFAGIGTVLQTAQWMKRDSVGIELNPEYVEMAKKVIEQPPRWWRRKHPTKPRPKDCQGQRRLFA